MAERLQLFLRDPGNPGPEGVPAGSGPASASGNPGGSAPEPVAPGERIPSLLAKSRELPRIPGVYLMKDAEGRVIYVGKSNCLPERVASYFVPSADLGPRKQPMLELVVDFDVIPCEGEWEALLLEARLIKDIHPRFNDRMQDGKTFPYLVVTVREEFPGVFITRDPQHERFRGARVFGPFTSSGSLRHAMQTLQRVFRFRTCDLDIRSDDPANRRFRPCLLHAIDQCTAPCANRITPEAYRADIDRFIRFLGSRRSAILREMRAEMEQASAAREYERAAALRDQVQALEKLAERETRSGDVEYDWQPEVTSLVQDPSAGLRSLQRTLGLPHAVRCIEAIDIAHLGGTETVGSKVAFIDGRPFKDGYRRFRIRCAANDDYAAIREVVSRRYREAGEGHELYPDLILIDGGIGQLRAAMDAFAQLERKPPAVIGLAKREELIWTVGRPEPIRLGRANPGLKLCQSIRDEAHRFAQHYHHLLRTKRTLTDDVGDE